MADRDGERGGGTGAARRRRERRLRAHWRHEQLSLCMLLAAVGHHSWQSKTSVGVQTARGEESDERDNAEGQVIPPPAGTQHFKLDDEDSVSELYGGRPAELEEPRPQAGDERHGGVGWELVMNTSVPQLGWDVTEHPPAMELYWWEKLWRHGTARNSEAALRLTADVPKLRAQYQQRMQAASGSRSSNKVGGRRKKKKRRKKLPKTSSSHSS